MKVTPSEDRGVLVHDEPIKKSRWQLIRMDPPERVINEFIRASATELIIAFIMGMGGSIQFAWSGLVDIRVAMIILGGSLFGIQLGAIGTTYVKPYMIKLVMGVIMILVLLSRLIVIPVYLSILGYIGKLTESTVSILKTASFSTLGLALAVGTIIILYSLWHGRRADMEQKSG